MTAHRVGLFIVILAALLLSGCLWVQTAEFHVRINPNGSGTGTVLYHNICYAPAEISDSISTKDVSDALSSLNEQYLHGVGFEQEYNQVQVTGKRLFRRDSVLSGEVTFTFDSLAAFNFYRYQDSKGEFISNLVHPLFGLYHTAVLQSNAQITARAEGNAVLVWPASTTQFDFTVSATLDSLYPTKYISLTPIWLKDGGDSSWVR
jgi:hypothetical protein